MALTLRLSLILNVIKRLYYLTSFANKLKFEQQSSKSD